ncbi:sulfatase-like hydrolase/transferase [Dyadobacter sp. CY261]|uniref:sulfatase-like hydrolase/transferase n=1 Tax=Dyadobacter sp. CY261 TaxID=2907203 RepID=UPI002103FB5B|nr:sulfatase-like hydrolase/transferase [Dyadobacter sp. CY261]
MGLIDPKTTKLPETPASAPKWEDNPDREWDAMAMAVHAAMIDRMDQGIGRIIHALKQTGELDNTLILFLTDNGASPENCAKYGPGFDRPSETRDGQKIVYATEKQVMPGPQTSYASIGARWASVANTPYRYAKAESFEGGVNTPMIAFWPKGITAKKGGFSDHTGHVMDLMATFCELSGAVYPKQFNNKPIKPTTGASIVTSFGNNPSKGHPMLFNEHFGARYARQGNWKLVSPASDSAWQLYDLSTDRSETTNLAEQHSDKVKRLASLWHEWANTHQVFPKPGKPASSK